MNFLWQNPVRKPKKLSAAELEYMWDKTIRAALDIQDDVVPYTKGTEFAEEAREVNRRLHALARKLERRLERERKR